MQDENTETPQRFFKIIEAGDIAFLYLIEYGIVVFGITKHGKTTFSHHLIDHRLQAYKNPNTIDINYRLFLEKNKNSQAKIGATIHSETEIPNMFKTGIKIVENKQLVLIDNPGQKDSFGINRVLSNAYFHYRIFSKIQNMKFILLFDYPQFCSNIKETNLIFNNFFKSFQNLKFIKNQLLKSICIVFSKVDKKISLSDVHLIVVKYKEGMQTTKHFEDEEEDFICKLIDECKQNDKIKLFRQAEIGVSPESGGTLLKEINSKLEFFSRKLDNGQQLAQAFQGATNKNQNLTFTSKKEIPSLLIQQKVSMENIKFSQSNKIITLGQNQRQKQQTDELFKQFGERGDLLFQVLFQTLQELVLNVLFENDSLGMTKNNKLSQTQILREKRNSFLKRILQNLSTDKITYDQQEKYHKTRYNIIKSYTQALQNTVKAQNFIERLSTAIQIYQFCQKYTLRQRFNSGSQEEIRMAKIDFECVILKLAQFYNHAEQLEVLSKFLYNLNTFMNQILVFRMIILPNGQKSSNNNPNQKVKHDKSVLDPRLAKFLSSLTNLSNTAVRMNDEVIRRITQEFNIKHKDAINLQKSQIINLYIKKYPNIIFDQRDKSDRVLKHLSQIDLDQEQKIKCQILVFKKLQMKYFLLTELRCFDEKKYEQSTKSQPIERMDETDLKILIKSLILYLKSVKKMKELTQYNQYKSFKAEVCYISFLVWTYLVKLFYYLLEISSKPVQHYHQEHLSKKKKRKDSMKKEVPATGQQNNEKYFYKKIIIEILSNCGNYHLIQETFDKLLQKYDKKFKSITIRNSAESISEQTKKMFKIFGQESYDYFLDSKREVSKQIIQTKLIYAQMLHRFGLKEKALLQCYGALKYAEFSVENISQIEEKIEMMKISDSQVFWTMEEKDVIEFEVSLTTRKQLTQFLNDNSHITHLECVDNGFLEQRDLKRTGDD